MIWYNITSYLLEVHVTTYQQNIKYKYIDLNYEAFIGQLSVIYDIMVAFGFNSCRHFSQMHYKIPLQKRKGHEVDCFVVTGGVAIYPLTASNTFGNVALTTPTLRCRVAADVLTFIPIFLEASDFAKGTWRHAIYYDARYPWHPHSDSMR